MKDDVQRRLCGDCCLCCKLMGVKELQKPPDKWCDLVQIGRGCSIYETRPESCKKFDCLWVLGLLPEELSPRKTRAVVWVAPEPHNGQETVIIHLDKDYGEREEIRNLVEKCVAMDFRVIVVQGSRRRLITSDLGGDLAELREELERSKR